MKGAPRPPATEAGAGLWSAARTPRARAAAANGPPTVRRSSRASATGEGAQSTDSRRGATRRLSQHVSPYAGAGIRGARVVGPAERRRLVGSRKSYTQGTSPCLTSWLSFRPPTPHPQISVNFTRLRLPVCGRRRPSKFVLNTRNLPVRTLPNPLPSPERRDSSQGYAFVGLGDRRGRRPERAREAGTCTRPSVSALAMKSAARTVVLKFGGSSVGSAEVSRRGCPGRDPQNAPAGGVRHAAVEPYCALQRQVLQLTISAPLLLLHFLHMQAFRHVGGILLASRDAGNRCVTGEGECGDSITTQNQSLAVLGQRVGGFYAALGLPIYIAFKRPAALGPSPCDPPL